VSEQIPLDKGASARRVIKGTSSPRGGTTSLSYISCATIPEHETEDQIVL